MSSYHQFFKNISRIVLGSFIVSTLCITAFPAWANSDNFNTTQKKEIENIIGNYLVNNPEILVKASQALQQRQEEQMVSQAKGAIQKHSSQLFNSNSPIAGNPKGKVTLVEFFDYQCVHCRHMSSVIQQLVQNNKDLRVVYKEFPIFGGASEYAAKVALALNKQNKYAPFHDAVLNSEERLTEKGINRLAQQTGADMTALRKTLADPNLQKELQANTKLAQSLGIVGTPAFIVAPTPTNASGGRQPLNNKDDLLKADNVYFIPSAVGVEVLQEFVNKAKG